jgi:flagellar biosynthetic protein FlhB
MAEEDQDQKTEEPSGKRLEEAREKGQLIVSREMSTFIILLASFLVFTAFVPMMGLKITNAMRVFIEKPDQISLDGPGVQTAMYGILSEVGLATILTFAVLFFASALGTMIQTGFFLSFEMIKADFTRLSIMSGISRLFSMNAVMELLRSFVKIVVLGYIAYIMVKPIVNNLVQYTGLNLSIALAETHRVTIHILSVLLIVVALMAIFDWFYQKHVFMKGLKMTKQEVKDEFKQTEGDPIIKSRLRQIRMDRARRRMIANVPKADVVVTNPTHFAIALQYDNKTMKAPVLLAKGTDKIAERIRAIANENNIPIVSNPPLARALYDTVDVDHPIKPEHYKAVAEIISYVFKLKKKKL